MLLIRAQAGTMTGVASPIQRHLTFILLFYSSILPPLPNITQTQHYICQALTNVFTMLDHSRLSEHLISHSSGSSSSIDHDNPDLDETDGFFRSFRRAGGPYLCSLPAITTPISSSGYRHLDLLNRDTPQIYLHTYQIIKDEGVTYSSIGLEGRLSRIDCQQYFGAFRYLQLDFSPVLAVRQG